jgi:hypothetical protein
MRPRRACDVLWNEGLCGRHHDSPQLMRQSLGLRSCYSDIASSQWQARH